MLAASNHSLKSYIVNDKLYRNTKNMRLDEAQRKDTSYKNEGNNNNKGVDKP